MRQLNKGEQSQNLLEIMKSFKKLLNSMTSFWIVLKFKLFEKFEKTLNSIKIGIES